MLYLTNLLDSRASYNVISTAIYAIKWAHSMNGLADPTENGFIKNLQEAARRLRSTKSIKKDAVTSQMLIELCDIFFRKWRFISAKGFSHDSYWFRRFSAFR